MKNYDLLDRDKIEEAYDILVTATRGNSDYEELLHPSLESGSV